MNISNCSISKSIEQRFSRHKIHNEDSLITPMDTANMSAAKET
jgi:hypothetical protein